MYVLHAGLNYKFLVAYTGEKENPQNKIIAASAEYTQSDWKMRYNSKLHTTFLVSLHSTSQSALHR
jgi:hypothetical protein